MPHSRPRIPSRLALVFAIALPVPAPAEEDPAARHQREVESWRQERLEGLRRPDSWLTLVGLAWLQEGENTCGSDPESAIVLPASVPARVGVVRLRRGKVEIEAVAGSGLRHQGRPVRRMELRSDADAEATTLEIGTVRFYVIERSGKLGVRIKDSASPTYTGFQGLDYYPVSWDWRKEARFEAYDPPRSVEIPTILGTVSEMTSPGAVIFEIAGRTHRLEAYEGSDENELFLVFGDTTNRLETYGGGRFLYARRDGERAVVDFNKAYNPPCVFSVYATCPLPAPENRLPVPVRAGEKMWGDAHH